MADTEEALKTAGAESDLQTILRVADHPSSAGGQNCRL